MSKVIFSSWAGKVVDNRGRDTRKSAPVKDLVLPLEYDGHRVKALISWNGIVVADEKVNIVDMAYAYLKEAQKLSCGECTVGYAGMKVMLDTLSRILGGKGGEKDIELLRWLGGGIKENSRCSFCANAVTPILDTIEHYKEEYRRCIGGKKAVSGAAYVTQVSAPCMQACPAHQDIPGYIELIRNKRYEEALAVIRRTNCLPSMTGRACVAFCEAKCVRNDIDSPLAIRMLKRVPADYEVASGVKPGLKKVRSTGVKVAVIGAGPAGLAGSYNLALRGYKVTVFDEQPSGGGMAWVGIPAYRLPRDVFSDEVEFIKKAGVDLRFDTRLGRDITLDSLHNERFKAIFLATGAHLSREMGIEGENEVEEGLLDGIEFLQEVNQGKKIKARGRAAIIGGGNVAIDCARTCLRLGFKDVTIVYRRSRAEMPGRKEEVEEAEKEGAKVRFLAAPVKILSRGGRVTGVECVQMKLGEPDASGRRRPIPIPGSEFVVEADLVLPAIGEMPDLSFLPKGSRVEMTPDGTLKVEPISCQTTQPGIFAGGDCATGPATIIEAIAAGNRAAESIDQYLKSGKTAETEEDMIVELTQNIDLAQRREAGITARSARFSPEQLSIPKRLAGFAEVEKVFSDALAVKEAGRCLRCYRVMLLAIEKGN